MSFNLKKKLAKFFLIDFIWFSLFLVPFAQAQAADNLYFVHSDHLGSNTVITDEKGEAVTQNRYYPYGSDKSSEGDQSLTERKYTSQIKDEETGIYYYNARYYDPALGTFVSPDEVDDSLNRYGYVKNNPILYADPSGNIIITTTAILLGISTVAFYASAVGFGVVAGGIGYDIINDHAYTIPVLNISHEPSASSERLAADTKQLGADILHGAYLAGSIAQAAMPIGQAIDNYMASRASQASTLETIRVYRGIRNPETINNQLAGGLRNGEFTLDELQNLPTSELLHRSSIDNPFFIDRVEVLEASGLYTNNEIKAWALAQSAMDISPWISTSTSYEVAERFAQQGGYIIEANVPRQYTVDISQLSSRVYNIDIPCAGGEFEIGVLGGLRTEWFSQIHHVTNYNPY